MNTNTPNPINADVALLEPLKKSLSEIEGWVKKSQNKMVKIEHAKMLTPEDATALVMGVEGVFQAVRKLQNNGLFWQLCKIGADSDSDI